jgi:hypothetical protein
MIFSTFEKVKVTQLIRKDRGKVKIHPITGHEGPEEGNRGITPLFL